LKKRRGGARRIPFDTGRPTGIITNGDDPLAREETQREKNQILPDLEVSKKQRQGGLITSRGQFTSSQNQPSRSEVFKEAKRGSSEILIMDERPTTEEKLAPKVK